MTSKKIEALKPRDKRFTVSDEHGLTLRVYETGRKSWFLRISKNGRTTDAFLGRWPETSLLQARQLARRKKKELGQEPPKGYVFNDAFKLWCNLKRGRIVSFKDEKMMLERHLLPFIKNRQLDEITAPLIVHVMKPIEKSGHQVTLKRVIMRCREILDLAVCAGFIQHNPIERLNRIYAPPVVTPMPAIDWRDLPSAMAVIATAPRKIQIIFLWSLCSMLRPGETAKLRWDWIQDGILEIPACEMKKGRIHRVPLTDQMRFLLREAKRISPHKRSAFVFPSRNGNKAMSSQTLTKFLHSTSLSGKLVAHGIRSIARCWMADHGFPFDASEACLSHVTGSAVTRAYQRSDLLDARKHIYKSWNSYVFLCARSAEIPVETDCDTTEPKKKS